MPLMSGGDAVVRSILGHGISTIYCLPGRPERSSVQRHVRRRRRARGGAYAPRAGRRLYGARRRPGDGQTRGLFGGARSGLPQLDRRARHRLFDRRAGARAGRPDPELRHRQGPRLPARDSRPDRHPAQADKIGGACGQPAGRTRDRRPRVQAAAIGTAAAGGPGSPARHAADARRGRAVPSPCARSRAGAGRGGDRAGRRSVGQGRVPGDLRRRRCAGRSRRGARAGRAAHRAGRRPIGAAAACSTTATSSAICCRAGMRSGRRPTSCSRSARGCNCRSVLGAPTTTSS